MKNTEEHFQISIGSFQFHLLPEDIAALDLVEKPNGSIHFISNHQSAFAKQISVSDQGKTICLELNGTQYMVQIKNPLDLRLEKMGFSSSAIRPIKEVRAPMPGLVLDILVQEGATIQEGERLLILEAMKMENSLLMPTNAIVKRILVKAGEAVEKNQVLIEFE